MCLNAIERGPNEQNNRINKITVKNEKQTH